MNLAEKMENIRLRWVPFIKTLKVEPYVFALVFSAAVKMITIQQLVQDKICRVKYNYSDTFCIDINNEDYPLIGKDRILTDSARIQMYTTYIVSFPGLFLSLFVGSWSDKYIDGRKILMSWGILGAAIETIFQIMTAFDFKSDVNNILYASIPAGLTGGLFCSLTAIYAYISKTTQPDMLAIRFAILMLIMNYVNPLATIVGGWLLNSNPIGSSGQLHNYISVLMLSFLLQIFGFLWVLIVINERNEQNESESVLIEDADLDNQEQSNENDSGISEQGQTNSGNEIVNTQLQWYKSLKHIFDIENARKMIMTSIKKRPNYDRAQIFLILLSEAIVLFGFLGSKTILFQYAQAAFNWGSKEFSDWSSFGSLYSASLMMISVPILVRKMKVTDAILAIIGIVSLFLSLIVRGSFLSSGAFIFSYFVGSLQGTQHVATRSILSKIVPQNEVGQVFGFLSSVESVIPIVAAAVYTEIFTSTIDWYPGLVFHFAAAILLVPLLVFMWIDLVCSKFDKTLIINEIES